MSWKSLGKPSGKSCHKNTSTRQWRSSPSAWLPTWLWLPVVVTPSICSNSVRLQVCILISSPTNWLFSETPTDYAREDNAQNAEKWGFVLVEIASISLSFSNTFQPNLAIKCMFDCLTVVQNFMQKSSSLAMCGKVVSSLVIIIAVVDLRVCGCPP